MKKVLFVLIGILATFIFAFYIGSNLDSFINIFNKPKVEEKSNVLEQVENTNFTEETISPNAVIIFKKYYTKCAHIDEQTETVSEELVNITKDKLSEKYPSWNIEDFSSTKIVLWKDIDDICENHYVLRDVNGYITIYKLDSDFTEELYQKTEISVEYLPETDRQNLSDGIFVYSLEELSEIIQDFE